MRGKDGTREDPCLSLGFKCHFACDLLQECSYSPFSAEPLERFLFPGVLPLLRHRQLKTLPVSVLTKKRKPKSTVGAKNKTPLINF